MTQEELIQSVSRLASGFTEEFAEWIQGSEKMEELLMDLAAEFVEKNIPVVSEDAQIDVAAELVTSVAVVDIRR